jgi:hypothetical protein
LEFVPIYKSANTQRPEKSVQKVLSHGAKVIFGFKKSESREQANMKPFEASRI